LRLGIEVTHFIKIGLTAPATHAAHSPLRPYYKPKQYVMAMG